ncbi:MAG TPA: hypothetical protein VFY52_04965 [Thermoleophilaceae bacterium]|nr:hypothetical protein [Thermoleophilaceae bacterium]
MHQRHIPALLGLLLGAAALLGLTAPSHAAFPGRNGKIAVAYFDDPSGGVGPARWGIGLLNANRAPSQERAEVIECTDERIPPRECPLDHSSPAFSPNGRWIAFDRGRRIAVVRTNGTGLRLLPVVGTDPGNPAWSPKGDRIVFDAARSTAVRAVRDLYVVPASGSGRAKRVARNAGNPTWSVRGLLAFERPFASIPPAPRRIWVSQASGAGARPVSSGTASRPDFSRDPDFSPDGKRLLYFSLARSRLTVVGTDGRGTRRLAAATAAAQHPAWSPDGRRLAWSWNGIYVARADGTHARRIAKDRAGPMGSFSFSTFSPSWQPLAPFAAR